MIGVATPVDIAAGAVFLFGRGGVHCSWKWSETSDLRSVNGGARRNLPRAGPTAPQEPANMLIPIVPATSVTLYADDVRNTLRVVWPSEGLMDAPGNASPVGLGRLPGHGNGDELIEGACARELPEVGPAEQSFTFRSMARAYYGHADAACLEYVLDSSKLAVAPAHPEAVKATAAASNALLAVACKGDTQIVRLDQRIDRTASQKQALRAAAEAQIVADRARFCGEVKTAIILIKSSRTRSSRAMRADRRKLNLARLTLRQVQTSPA